MESPPLADSTDAAVRVLSEIVSADALLVPGTYNGVFFDVAASNEAPIVVTALHVSGTQGSVRAFATRRSESQVYAMTDWRQWVSVGAMNIGDADSAPHESFHPASAKVESVVLTLDQPVPIAAGDTRGFHIHLSYAGGARLATKEVLEPLSVVVKDRHASVLAGAGYVGFTPFFTRQGDGLCDGQWRDGRGLVGGIVYERAAAIAMPTPSSSASTSSPDFATHVDDFAARLTSLDLFAPMIGGVNRQLISEWSDEVCDPPLLTLQLPTTTDEALPPGLLPLDAPAALAELDALWTGHRALRELWLRHLAQFGWGLDAWLAELRALHDPILRAKSCATRAATLHGLLSRCGALPPRAFRIAAWLEGAVKRGRGRAARTKLSLVKPLPGEPIFLRGLLNRDALLNKDADSHAGGGGGGGPGGRLQTKVDAVQVKLYKPDASAKLGLTLEDTEEGAAMAEAMANEREEANRSGGGGGKAAKARDASSLAEIAHLPPPLVTNIAAGCIAALSGALAVGQSLLEVNGVRVHGHEHGTRLLKNVEGAFTLRLSKRRVPLGGGVASNAADDPTLAAESLPAQPSNWRLLLARWHVRLALKHYKRAEAEQGDSRVLKALQLANLVLLSRLATFKRSAEFACGRRLMQVQPAAARLSCFSLIRRVGRGSFGVVYAARKEDTLSLFALKMIHLTRLRRARDEEHVKLERVTLERTARLNCPFLAMLCYAFREGPWLVLAMPLYAGGTLQTQIEERAEIDGGLPVEEVRWIVAHLALALGALHSLHLCHRDVKPSNVVLKHSGYWVLTDFGLSEPPGVATKSGTRGYWAPEVILQEPQTEAADWWSVGVVAAYIATGNHPFYHTAEANGGGGGGGGGAAALDDRATTTAPGSAAHASSSTAVAQQTAMVLPLNGSFKETAAEKTERRRRQKEAARKEKEKLNEATLHSPINIGEGKGVTAEMRDLTMRLLERDVAKRLGSAAAVRAHAFLGEEVEWELLERQVLPAPFKPNAGLVYAKDVVPDLSHPAVDLEADTSFKRRAEEQGGGVLGETLGEWDYAVDAASEQFGDEMRDYVAKFTAVSLA